MHARLRLLCAAAALALAGAAGAWAVAAPDAQQPQKLTLQDVIGPGRTASFNVTGVPSYRWFDDEHTLRSREVTRDGEELGSEPTKVHCLTGEETPVFDTARFEATLRAAGFSEADARRLAYRGSPDFNDDHTGIELTHQDRFYFYDIPEDRLTRFAAGPGPKRFVNFAPDGSRVGYLRDYNLYVADAEREIQLTTDGHEDLLTGELDWVYMEELYGRGNRLAWWWSPTSEHIAFLQLDQTPVPFYSVDDHLPYHHTTETTRYPKAGDPNPIVTLHVVSADGGPVVDVDLDGYTPTQSLIVRVAFSPDGRHVVHQVQNREQTWLDLRLADVETGASRTLFRETTPAWVSITGHPTWLGDGTFLWLSDRTGWRHLYRYNREGDLVRQVTSGEWDVRSVHGVDEENGFVYFSGTERNPIGLDAYRAGLDGGGFQRLTSGPAGSYGVSFSTGFSFFLNNFSSLTIPNQLRLHRADGTEEELIAEGRVPDRERWRTSEPELLEVPTRDGFPMSAILIKPLDFDPEQRYPVIQFTYAGPRASRVRDNWGVSDHAWAQLLAAQGIAVWFCDNRTASNKGAISAWPVHRNFGETELRDIEDGIEWLKENHAWVDPERIGISGWSYGGYMVAYALTKSQTFSMGISGAPVTDWRMYDTIYTERYMGLPQENPEGYRKSSPRFFAEDLHGRLLMIHPTMDDNVHVHHTVAFAYELQKAGKQFELMLYPRQRHSVTDSDLRRHMRQMQYDFIMRQLRPGGG